MKWRFVAVAYFLVMCVIQAQNGTIGTGSQSGTYYAYGGMLATIWNREIPQFNIRAEVTAASVENMIKVDSKQQLAGIAMGDSFLNAARGNKPFPRKMDVRILFAMYPNVVHFMVLKNSDIHSLQDIRGKRISLGAPGSGTLSGSSAIIAALGIPQKELKVQRLNYTATTNALANGQIDVGVIVGSAGVGAITQLAFTRDIRILSFSKKELDTVSQALPAYSATTVPAETYHNVDSFTAPSVWNVVAVNAGMDDDLAYAMVKTAMENMDEVVQVLPVAKDSTVANISRFDEDLIHPGVKRYLAELASS